MKHVLALTLAFVAGLAQAGGKSTGVVTQVSTTSTGVVLFTVSGGSKTTGQPACATKSGRYAVDTSTPAGKAHEGWLGRAYALGKSVTVMGTGTCSGDSENVLETTIEQ